jgi:alkylated DNA repair dioxygenase AlkB
MTWGKATPFPSQITQHLFIGSNAHAAALATANPLNIGAVLNVGTRRDYKQAPGIEYQRVPLEDTGAVTVQDFNTCMAFIEKHRDNNLLVHCNAGRNRSAAIVIGYLLKTGAFAGWRDAFRFIKGKREMVGCHSIVRDSILRRTGTAIGIGEKPMIDMKSYVPKYECLPSFLSATEAAELFNWLEQQKGLVLETGSCDLKPTHATIQWGERQGYLSCVPKAFRVRSAGTIPEFLRAIKERIEKQYGCYFNSIQVNKHFNQDAIVHSHADSPAGHICMLSVGAERDFILRRRSPYYTVCGQIRLTSGSLLTFFPKEQWKHTHEMPKSKERCGVRYGLIFRYISQALVPDGVIGKGVDRQETNRLRDLEYELSQKLHRQPTDEEMKAELVNR